MHSNTVGKETKHPSKNEPVCAQKFNKTVFSDTITAKDFKTHSAQAVAKPANVSVTVAYRLSLTKRAQSNF